MSRFAVSSLLVLFLLAHAGLGHAAGKFAAPKPTIIPDPDFRPDGQWLIKDGTLLGVDNKPLADHKIYSLDTQWFLDRLKLGIEEKLSQEERNALATLASLDAVKDKRLRQIRLRRFKKQYGKKPEKHPLAPLAEARKRLQDAKLAYGRAEAQINYAERVRMIDRIDLDEAPDEKGEKERESMKQAIRDMAMARSLIEKEYPEILAAGKEKQMAPMRAKAAAERFATVINAETPMFVYQKFARTPMARGLAKAKAGEVHIEAKPLLLPQGMKVTILEEKEIEVPAGEGQEAMTLAVTRVEVYGKGIKQHNGRELTPVKLRGWVLGEALQAE